MGSNQTGMTNGSGSLNISTPIGSLNITVNNQSAQPFNLTDFTEAGFTYFYAYAPCCVNNDNYDATFNTSICLDSSTVCANAGNFSTGQRNVAYVKSHNIVRFYDASDPMGLNFTQNYAGKKMRLDRDNITLEATIEDLCLDSDCNGCCSANAINGYTVDMEYYTVLQYFGTVD